MTDIHKRQKYLDSTIQKIKDSELSEENTELVLEFRNHLMAENLSTERISRHKTTLNTLAPYIDFRLDDKKKS